MNLKNVILAFLLGQWATQGLLVNDEAAKQGYSKSVNCTGAGVTCTSDGFTWTVNVPGGGGGGSGLPSDPTACTAGQYVYDQDINGVLTCSAPPKGLPSDPTACGAGQFVTDQDANGSLFCGTPIGVAATFVTRTPDPGLANEQALSLLGTGVLKSTTGTGVVSIATGADIPTPVGTATALAADPADCTTGQYATTIGASGALTCAQVAYSQISGTPTSLAAEPYVTTAASANLSNESIYPICNAAEKPAWNGFTFSCATDLYGVAAEDHGTLLGNTHVFDFQGAGVVATYPSANRVTVTIPGSGPAPTTVAVYDEGALVGTASELDFTGLGVSTTFATGRATFTMPGPSVVAYKNLASIGTARGINFDSTASLADFTFAGTTATLTVPATRVLDEGSTLTLRKDVNFTGAGVSCVDNAGATRTDCTISGSAGAAYSTVQDEGGALTQRPTVNFTGAGVACVDNAGSLRTDCAIAGSTATTPGGVYPQVQYNNSGVFAGISELITDGTNAILIGTATEPAAPAAGNLKLYAMRPHGATGPALPFWKGGTTQVDYRLFPEMLSADPVWGCTQPITWGNTIAAATGASVLGSNTGTVAAVAWAATDERTRARWFQYPTTAAINLNAGYRSAGNRYFWRGNSAGLGGFYWWGSMNIATGNAGQRVFMGIRDSTTVLAAASDPNVALDTAYFGANAADTDLSICSNDNAGTATCTTLGANFPAKTANSAYDIAFWAQPNGSDISYYIRRLGTAFTATGSIATDLPRNTIVLGWDFNINSGTTAAIATMHFGGTCYIANP